MMEIEDNFLKQEDFDKIQECIMKDFRHQLMKDFRHQEGLMQRRFPWFYNDIIDSPDEVDKFQFTHMFYIEQTPTSEFIENLNPILEIMNPISLSRIKANLLTRTPEIIENEFHVDMVMSEEKLKQWTTSIFYVNTNNGYTKFEDGTKVESVANRMVSFPGNLKHTGTSCTNKKTRVVINFNYIKR